MSSPFSSFGGASASLCQRCQSPLPPNIVQCGYCSYDNTPVQLAFPESFLPSSNAASSFVQPGSQVNSPGQWYPNSPDNAFPTAQPGENGGQFSMNGQFLGPGNYQNSPAFYNTFPDQGQANNFLPGFMPIPETPEVSQPVMVKRRKLNMKKVVSLVIILLVLIGASATSYIVLTSRQGAKHTTSVSPGYPVPKGAPLFAETFANNSKQWDMQSMPGRYLVSIKNGNLILEDDDNKLFPMLLPGGKNFTNFKLIVNATLSKGDQGNGYGLCLRGTTDSGGYLTAYYRIELYGNRTYAVFKVATDANGNTSSTTLVDTTAHAAIKPVGQSNQIVVIANGSKITLIINGQTVQTFSDTSYASGAIALFVSNLPGTHPGSQATFSHLAIYPVNGK